MQDTRETLQHFNKSDFEDLRSLNNPSKPVERLFSGLSLLFDRKADWNSAQSLLSEPEFIKRLLSIKAEDSSSEKLNQLRSIINDPNLKEDSIREISAPALEIFRYLKFLSQETSKEDISEKKETQKPIRDIGDKLELENAKLDQWLPARMEAQKAEKESIKSDKKNQEIQEGYIDDIGLKLESQKSRHDDYLPEYQAAEIALKDVEKEIYETGFCLQSDSPKVEKVLNCLCILIGEEPTPENGKALVANKEGFLKKIRHLKIPNLPQERVDLVRVKLQDPDLRFSNVACDCPAASNILVWITAVVNYWVVSSIIEKGDAAFSEEAQVEAKKQETEIIRSNSRLLEEDDGLTEEERNRIKELDKQGSIGEL